MNIKVDFDNIVVKEDKNDFNVKVLMLKGEKGDAGDGEPNVIDKIQVNGANLPVTNKTVNVPVPIVDSTLSSSSTNPVQNNTIYNALNNKVNNSALNNYYEISEIDNFLNDKANASIVDKKPYFFDNVASMKAYNLKEGDVAITTGYYSYNDGGSAEYIIKSSSDNYYETLNNNLVAELISNKYISPEQLGAYGDGEHDDADILQVFFNNIDNYENIALNNVYGLSKPVKLPTKYGISITGGSFKALNNFDNTITNALLYIDNENITHPDNFNVPSTGIRLDNLTFICNFITDGIEIKKGLNINIDKCLFILYKNYGINVSTTDCHDLLITNCQFKGNTYNGSQSELSNVGIKLDCSDAITRGCVFAYGYGGMVVNRSGNLIDNCHFYAHQNNGCNIKLGSYENILSNSYIDGGTLYLSSGWRNYITNNLILVSNYTEYIIKIGTDSPTTHNVSFKIENTMVHDLRADTKTPIDLITYEEQITNFTNSKILNTQIIAGNVNINNPLDGIQLNNTNPTILGLKKYVAPISGTTLGNMTEIDGSTQYYKANVSGNSVQLEFIGQSNFYQYLVLPFYVSEQSRIIANTIASGTAHVLFYDMGKNYKGEKKVTLDPGKYYVCVYKNVTECTLTVNTQ